MLNLARHHRKLSWFRVRTCKLTACSVAGPSAAARGSPQTVLRKAHTNALSERTSTTAHELGEIKCPAELISWPDGLKPKSGHVTKSTLSKLKVQDLRALLAGWGADSSGVKDTLVSKLLGELESRWAAQQQDPQASSSVASAARSRDVLANQSLEVAGSEPHRDHNGSSDQPSSSAGNLGALDAKWLGTSGPEQEAPSLQQLPNQQDELHQALTQAAAGMERSKPSPETIWAAGSSTHKIRKIKTLQPGWPEEGGATKGPDPHTASAGTRSAARHASGRSEDAQHATLGSRTIGVDDDDSDTRQVPRNTKGPKRHSSDPLDREWEGADGGSAADGDEEAGAPKADDGPPITAEEAALLYPEYAKLPAPPIENRRLPRDLGRLSGSSATQQIFPPALMGLVVMGSSAGLPPTPARGSPGLVFMRDRDVWLFDAGEDTQRQLAQTKPVRPSKLFRIFATAKTPERLAGLPGILCTLSATRPRGHEQADIPSHIFGPPGLAEYIADMLHLSDTYLESPIIVHEFCMHAVSEEEQEPQLYNGRAKVWRAAVPPDQLNLDGWTDGDLGGFCPTLGRATMKKGRRAGGGVLTHDKRAAYLDGGLPGPGDPSRQVPVAEMTWTIRVDNASRLVAAPTDSSGSTWGYVIEEPARAGTLLVDRALALGVAPGERYTALKDGRAVRNKDGRVVPPELVIGPNKPGRKLALLPWPFQGSATHLAAAAQGADLVVADVAGSCVQGDSADVDAEAGRLAGEAAESLGAKMLLLTGFRTGLLNSHQVERRVQHMADVAQSHFSGAVIPASDTTCLLLDRHDGPGPHIPAEEPVHKVAKPDLWGHSGRGGGGGGRGRGRSQGSWQRPWGR